MTCYCFGEAAPHGYDRHTCLGSRERPARNGFRIEGDEEE